MAHLICWEYDEVMIGNRKTVNPMWFKNTSKNEEDIGNEEKEKLALEIIRYSLTHYIDGWSPERTRDELCPELLEELKLTEYIKYIRFPLGYENEKCKYLASLVFPSLHLSARDITLHYFEQLLANPTKRLSRDFFAGKDGLVRAGYCLQYVISNFVSYRSVEELYFIFYRHGMQYLTKYSLAKYCRQNFDTPLDFLHHVLPDDEKSEFLYHYYKFYYHYQASTHKKKLAHMLGTNHKELVEPEEYDG